MSNEQLKDELKRNGTYREISYRWVNFTIYILAALVNSLPTQTFSSINTIVAQNFSYDPIIVTLNVLFFPILHPIFAVPVNWALDKFGMKIGCSIGGTILVAGAWFRTLISEDTVTWVLIGSILAAIGNVFILNSPSILANNWFKPASIPGIISFAVLANLISISLGSSLPGLLIDNIGTKTQIQQKIQSLFRIQAIAITIPIILLFIGLRNRPEIPPSKAAGDQQNNKQKYSEGLKKLFSNKEYLRIMLIMTLHYGATTSYLANLDQALSVLGLSNSGKVTGQVLISAMFAGIVGSFIFIQKVKDTLQYKSILCLCLLCSFLMFSLLQGVFIEKSSQGWIALIMGAGTGIFLIPTTSLIMAYSSEVVYPLGQGSATGYLFAASQTIGFGLGLGSAGLIQSAHNDELTSSDGGQKWKIYLFMGIHALMYLGAFLAGLTTKNMLNRTKYEASQIQKQKQTQEGFIFSTT